MIEPYLTTNDAADIANHLSVTAWGDRQHSDVTLEAFGKEYHLHKVILVRSQYFASMFSSGWDESSARRVVLKIDDPAITPAAVNTALHFIYGRAACLTSIHEALSLFACASFLGLSTLRADCHKFLLSRLSMETLRLYYEFFHSKCTVGGEEILSACRCVLITQAHKHPELLASLPTDTIIDLLTSDDLCVPTEYDRLMLALGLIRELSDAAESRSTVPQPLQVSMSRTTSSLEAACSTAAVAVTIDPDTAQGDGSGRADSDGGTTECAGGDDDGEAEDVAAVDEVELDGEEDDEEEESGASQGSSVQSCMSVSSTASAQSSLSSSSSVAELEAIIQRLRAAVLPRIRFSLLTAQQLFTVKRLGLVPPELMARGLWRKEYARAFFAGAMDPKVLEDWEPYRRALIFSKAFLFVKPFPFDPETEAFFAFGSMWSVSVKVFVEDTRHFLSIFFYRKRSARVVADASNPMEYVDAVKKRKFTCGILILGPNLRKQCEFTNIVELDGEGWGWRKAAEFAKPDDILTDSELSTIVSICPAID